MTQFGKMKLEMIIPESISGTLFAKYIHEGIENLPNYERFFDECLEICKKQNINLRSKWSKFYDECDKKNINAKKTAETEPKRPEPFQKRILPPSTEEDFWKVERDVVLQPEKWKKLGYIKNPWANFMLTLSTYEYMELFLYYLKAHPVTEPEPLPDELLKYHEKLKAYFAL